MVDKKKVTGFIIFLLLAVGIIIAIRYPKYKKEIEEKEKTYQHAIKSLDNGSYFYAQYDFESIPGYKDADELAIYSAVAERAETYLDEKWKLKEKLDRIPAEYKGDHADVIAGFREYLETDYTKERDAYWAEKEKYCLVSGCGNLRKSGGIYCSVHECAHAGCTYGAIDGSKYCKKHQSDEKAGAAKKAGTTRTSSSSKKKKSGNSSNSYKDPDDYMDVEGYYYDYRDEFESEDDAWDYLDDEWDEWD